MRDCVLDSCGTACVTAGAAFALNGWKRASILRTLRQYDSHAPLFEPNWPSGL
jgi:hypothetical protein